MSLDQQISQYEDRINQLEQLKRNLLIQNSFPPDKDDKAPPENDLNKINVDLDQSYEHIAILKIRKMMGF